MTRFLPPSLDFPSTWEYIQDKAELSHRSRVPMPRSAGAPRPPESGTPAGLRGILDLTGG
jgi:hypothetical protein